MRRAAAEDETTIKRMKDEQGRARARAHTLRVHTGPIHGNSYTASHDSHPVHTSTTQTKPSKQKQVPSNTTCSTVQTLRVNPFAVRTEIACVQSKRRKHATCGCKFQRCRHARAITAAAVERRTPVDRVTDRDVDMMLATEAM